MNDYINYYDLLGIDKNASEEEIKKAYRSQAKKWHPDLNKDPDAPNMAKKINEAKEILLDEKKRKEYDLYLNNYKNNIYDNIKQETSTKPNNDSYYEEKTYTKWQYFKLYLKYYKKNIFRKILACIFVFLESLFCTILQGINYALAYILSYTGYYVGLFMTIYGMISIIYICMKMVIKIDLPPYETYEYVLIVLTSTLALIIGMSIKSIFNFIANKNPIYISKLNLFLFKKSIGYEKNDF